MKPQAARGFTWYWTPQLWRWNPADGPWRPEYGGPKTAAYLELTTAGMRAQESYDFWCESVFFDFDPEPWSSRTADAFHAHARGWCSPRANVFTYESGAVAGKSVRRPVHTGDSVEIGVILAGTRICQPERGPAVVSRPGDFFVYDSSRRCRIRWSNHRGIHATVRRSLIDDAFNGRMPEPEIVMQTLTLSPLAPFLRNHLLLMAQTMHRLSAPEQSMLTGQFIDLLLTALRSVHNEKTSETEERHRALFVAAQSYIDAHLSEPTLCIDQVAGALGCSRSTLYRAFASQGETVSNYIRERRLHWFWQLLHHAPAQATITSLALQCGFDNVGYVSKQFRRRFGVSPREARAMTQTEQIGP